MTLRNADAFKDPYGMDPPGATRGPDTADGGDTDLPRWDELNERWVPRSVETVMNLCSKNETLDYSSDLFGDILF